MNKNLPTTPLDNHCASLISRESERFVVEFNYETDTIEVKPRADEDPNIMLHIDELIKLQPNLFARGSIYESPELPHPYGEWKISEDSFEHIFGQFATRVHFMKHYLLIISMAFKHQEGRMQGKIETSKLKNFSLKHRYYMETRNTYRRFTMNRPIQQIITPEYIFPCTVNVNVEYDMIMNNQSLRVAQTMKEEFSLQQAHWIDIPI